jgi:hypothetical protein
MLQEVPHFSLRLQKPQAPLDPSAFFAFFFREMTLFWAARNATKNGTDLGRPSIRFATPKIITKRAKISRKFREY